MEARILSGLWTWVRLLFPHLSFPTCTVGRCSPPAPVSKVRKPDGNLGPHVQALEGLYFLDNSDPGDSQDPRNFS